ncbi:hypothetical protein ACFLYG_00380 [Chloroflexota bacterium]
MTTRKWRTAGKLGALAVTLAILGLAAMSVSPDLIPEWLPIQWLVGLGIVFIGLAILLLLFTIGFVVYSSREWLMGWRVINIYQSGTGHNAIVGSKEVEVKYVTKIEKSEPVRLIYDNVLWEDVGIGRWGGVIVKGPYCPKDLTSLATKRGYERKVTKERWILI